VIAMRLRSVARRALMYMGLLVRMVVEYPRRARLMYVRYVCELIGACSLFAAAAINDDATIDRDQIVG
jgi:hypothetical protein